MDRPARGTPEHIWWLMGASDEARIREEGMLDDARELVNVTAKLARRGDDRDQIIEWVLGVFTSTWPLRKKLKLAWRMVRDV